MRLFNRLSSIGIAFLLTSCTSVYGLTGADEGQRINEKWVEYRVIHPGLSIKILEPYSPDLMPISTVGVKSPSPLRHKIKFGTNTNSHELLIIGKYKKELFLDGFSYGTIWNADLVIKNGVMMIDGRPAARISE